MKKTIVCIIALTMVFMVGGFAQAEVSRDGLIAEYLFNGNANDTSGNENHGTVHGPILVDDRFGNPNSAYSFDKVMGDYIEVPDSDSLDISGAITIEAWVMLESPARYGQYVVESRDGSGGGYGINVGVELIQFWIDNGWPTLPISLETQKWHYVVGTYDGTNMIVYIDGLMVHNIPFTAPFLPCTTLFIGRHWEEGGFFPGMIDDIAIWERVLTPEEVLERYETVPPVPALTGYWNFDEGNGSTANDSSGFSNQGTIEGATWPSGKCGNTALSFDGGSDGGIDYVKVPNSDSINTSTFTVSFWVSISDLDKTMVFLHKRNGQWWRNFQVSYNTVGPAGEEKDYLKVKIDDNGTPTPSNDFENAAYAEVDLESGKFYYVAATYDQSYLRLFLNGSPIAQIAEFPIDMTGNVGGGDLYIGAHSAEHLTMNPTIGIIDEVRLYNYALTQEQIQADMEACTPPVPTLEERVDALESQVTDLQQELDALKGMESLVYSLEDQLNNLMQAIRKCPTTKHCLDEQ